MQHKKKLNIPFIEKEMKNLFDNALPDFIERMKKLERNNKDIQQVIQDDDAHYGGSNILRVILEFENDQYNTKSVCGDLYRKHQLLGNGAEIGYDKKDIMELAGSVKTDISEPVQAPTTTIPIEKEDIKRIISMLYSLTTYMFTICNQNRLSQKETDERTEPIFEMINKLMRLL